MLATRPIRLQPGDPVGVVAASGPVDSEKFETGLAVLAKRYRPTFDRPQVLSKAGFLAGDDLQRSSALNAAIADPGCRAVFLARGGYGLLRILPRIDLTPLASNPKPIIGFSDVTALLALCANAGLVTIHGPVVTQLGDLPDGDLEGLWELLENPGPRELLGGLESIQSGRAEGPLLGGNLEVLTRLLGSPYQPDFRDCILFLEDVHEPPYKIDRLMTHLQLAGVLDLVRGVVLGDFLDTRAAASSNEPSVREVLTERLESLQVPVAMGGAFGHGERNKALPYGAMVELDCSTGRLTTSEGAVL